jgi:hypothetical protein
MYKLIKPKKKSQKKFDISYRKQKKARNEMLLTFLKMLSALLNILSLFKD